MVNRNRSASRSSFLIIPYLFYLVSRFLHQFLLSLAGSGRNEIVSAMNIEDSMGILTLLDLIDEAMILLGHHLA